MGLEPRSDGAGLDNANRMYTEAEDQLILTKWWNKKLRAELSEELGRTEAALAQRFYAILKKQGLDPKTYRADMKQQGGKRHLLSAPAGQRAWTRDEDIALWRRLKAGEALDAAMASSLGRTLPECEERYEILKQANEAKVSTGDDGKQTTQSPATLPPAPPAKPVLEPVVPGEVASPIEEQEPESFLDALRQFPQQAGQLTHRMDAVENDVQYVKGNLQFVLESLAQGLHNVAQYLTGQGQDFCAFEAIKQENQTLRNEITELKQRMEREKKELRQVYNELEFWLSEFMEMRKIEKVANLGELIPKLKYSYDRFGVLLQIEREA